MKINLNDNSHLERLFACSNTENANYFGVSIRAVQKAKSTQKYMEYRNQRNTETSELLAYGFNRAVMALVGLLNNTDDRIVIQTAKTLIMAYQGQKTAFSDNWVNVDKILVSIKECSDETK